MDAKALQQAVGQLIAHVKTGAPWTQKELLALLEMFAHDMRKQLEALHVQVKDQQESVYVCMAQAKVNALHWAIDTLTTTGTDPQVAIKKIKSEMQELRNVIRKHARSSTMSSIPLSDSITKAFEQWQGDVTEPNIHYYARQEKDNEPVDVVQLASQPIDDELIPYVNRILKCMPHVAAAHLSKASAITDFRPVDKDKSEWLKEMSDTLGVEFQTNRTIESIAKQLKDKTEKSSD